jgi:hypothetical protein
MLNVLFTVKTRCGGVEGDFQRAPRAVNRDSAQRAFYRPMIGVYGETWIATEWLQGHRPLKLKKLIGLWL